MYYEVTMKIKQLGGTTVEVAIGIPIILIAFFGWIELCMVTYSMSVIDDAFTIAVSRAKKSGNWGEANDYFQQIRIELDHYGGALGTQLVPENSIKLRVVPFDSFDKLYSYENRSSRWVGDGGCIPAGYSRASDDCTERPVQYYTANPIALYNLSYIYQPLFSIWFPNINIRREIIAVQERERCVLGDNDKYRCISSRN